LDDPQLASPSEFIFNAKNTDATTRHNFFITDFLSKSIEGQPTTLVATCPGQSKAQFSSERNRTHDEPVVIANKSLEYWEVRLECPRWAVERVRIERVVKNNLRQ
jgi:hypothetical protein